MPHAVIFDMDGVLIDSYQAHFESWRGLAAEIGSTYTEEEFAHSFGRTSRDIIEAHWGKGLSPERIAEMDDRKEALCRQIMSRDFPLMPGAAELTEALHGAGIKLAVGSSGPPANVALTMERLNPDGRFEAIVTGVDVTRGKPDPEVFLIAAQRLRVEPASCAVVEDAAPGITAAKRAGMACIGLASTGRTREELGEADLVVDTLGELTPQRIAEVIDPTTPPGVAT